MNQNLATRFDYYRQTSLSLMKENPNSFAHQNYGPLGVEFLKKIRAINEKFIELLLDPGVVFHSQDLFDFLKKHPNSFQEVSELREAFSKSLGTKKIYRALYINPEELDYIKTHGMPSKYLSALNGPIGDLPQSILSVLTMRLGLLNQLPPELQQQFAKIDYSMSVTEEDSIAAAVVYQDSQTNPDREKSVILFELQVPVLDILWSGDSYLSQLATSWGRSIPTINVVNKTPLQDQTIKKTVTSLPYGKEVESFILFKIFPQEIIGARAIPDQFEYQMNQERIPNR